VHLGTRAAVAAIRRALPRGDRWLHDAARVMVEQVRADWHAWKQVVDEEGGGATRRKRPR
jgi:hypothetical protein